MDHEKKACRNCGGTEFYVRDVNFNGDAQSALPISAFSGSECRLRVCGVCGLVEWLLKPSSLKSVKEKYQRERGGA